MGFDISLASPKTALLSHKTVLAYPSLKDVIREIGIDHTQIFLLGVLTEADSVCDGRNTHKQLTMMAMMILTKYSGLSIGSIVMAIRDGLSKGKMFGKLTYPQVAEWINEHMEEIQFQNDLAHASRRKD